VRAAIPEELGDWIGGTRHEREYGGSVKVAGMDATSALADLTEIAAQVRAAVVFAHDGSVLASTSLTEEESRRLARTALDLLAAGADVRATDWRKVTQVEVSLHEGSVFVVRDGERGIVATVAAGSASGLVLYDLRSCLGAIDEPEQPPRRRATKKKSTADA
jgi:predicted regulator of Ras-like GTPase activity (Roadblock/LC7/MglB family)